MSPENSNAVAVERRMDLASLFCMIGRHGPAVVVAVLAMVSLLAGFIIYRTVRGKRRKATAADSDGKPPGAERDAAVIQTNPDEKHSPMRATEISDGGSPEMKGDVNLKDHNIRRRCAAAVAPAEKPCFTPKDDTPEVERRHTPPNHRVGMAIVEEARKTWQSDTNTEANCHHIATTEVAEAVAKETHDVSSCPKEGIIDENNEEDKVLKAECQDDERIIRAAPKEKTRQEEEANDDRLQYNVTITETNSVGSALEESVVLVQDAPVSIICNVKEEESEPQDPDGVVSDNCHTAKEQKKTECEEAEEECEDYQLNPQQAVTHPSTLEQEIHPSCTEQDQSNHVMDEVIPLVEGSDRAQCCGPTGEMSEEVVDVDSMANPLAVHNNLSQFSEGDTEVEQNEEITTCCQEDGVESNPAPPTEAETNDRDPSDVIAEERAQISNSADCSDLLLGFQQPQREYKITSSLDEDTSSAALNSLMPSHVTKDKENDPIAVLAGPNIAPQDSGNVESLVIDEEESPSHVSSLYKEQQSVKMMNDVYNQEKDFSVANEAENITSSESVRQTSDPLMLTTCHDQEGDQIGNENSDLAMPSAFEAPGYNVCPTAPSPSEEISFPGLLSAPQDWKIEETTSFGETSACNSSLTTLLTSSSQDQQADLSFDMPSLTPPAKSKEICQSDMFSSYQDQAKITEDFSEVATSSALLMTASLNSGTFPICVPSFEHSDLGYSELSSPDVGKESGISSMAVSPDLQDPGFDAIVENIVEGDQLSADQTEFKDSFLIDDTSVSYKYNGNRTGMVFGPYPIHQPQLSPTEQADWTSYESYAANEDTFGHEIEDRYHREMNQFMAQIVESITSLADELTEEKGTKVTVKVEEKKEKKAEVSGGKKAGTKTEEEEEEAVEYEKTEISIMEATMDHNEWITDSNYQVLPWMNISSPSVDQNHNKNNQLSSEKSAAVTDVPCVDTPDELPDVKPTSSPSLVDENNKKVLAVQPMPQNVNVTFRVHYFTQSPYQTVAVTGNQQELGNWREFISLERAKDGHWSTVVSLPAESHVEWKFLLLDKGEVCRWEECGNRLLETGSGDDLLVHKWWGTL